MLVLRHMLKLQKCSKGRDFNARVRHELNIFTQEIFARLINSNAAKLCLLEHVFLAP